MSDFSFIISNLRAVYYISTKIFSINSNKLKCIFKFYNTKINEKKKTTKII